MPLTSAQVEIEFGSCWNFPSGSIVLIRTRPLHFGIWLCWSLWSLLTRRTVSQWGPLVLRPAGSIPGSGRSPGGGHTWKRQSSSILAWRIPWTEEPGGLQFVGSIELDTTEQAHLFYLISFPSKHSRWKRAIKNKWGETEIERFKMWQQW